MKNLSFYVQFLNVFSPAFWLAYFGSTDTDPKSNHFANWITYIYQYKIKVSVVDSEFKHFIDKLKFRPIANQMEVELDVISSDSIQRMTFPSRNRLYI